MSRTAPSRRTVLKLLASIEIGSGASSSGVAAKNENGTEPCVPAPPRSPGASDSSLASGPNTYMAVVDRIVGGRFAVLLLEEDGELVDRLVVSAEKLASRLASDEWPSVEERDVLAVTLDDGSVIEARMLPGETERRRKRAENGLDCLSEDRGWPW